jgi:hypothetical protein
MQPYEQIVEDILTILTADTDPSEDALRDVDTRYADAVNELNERLTACDRLLHKGHRAEAIQECDRHPNLLDSIAVLDFPEAAQWGEYVRQFGLAAPPTLRAEIAVELNDAYTMEAKLGDVLQQHRTLALARAPLGPRLKVLRQIARQDAGNPVWQEDVKNWERVRVGQLPDEAEQAVARNDLASIAQLEQEVRTTQWLEPPPTAVAKRIGEAHRQLRGKQARRQLESLEKDLTQAYADFDVHRARNIRKQWQVHAPIGIVRQDDPLLELVSPALEWLEEQDRLDQEQQEYEAALAELEAALDQQAPRHELQRLGHAVMRFEGGLPESLEQRLQERFAAFEKAASRRTAFILTSIVLSMLLIAAATVWGIRAQARANRLAGHQTNLTRLIDSRMLLEASSYADELEQNEPSLFGEPKIQDLVKSLETATQAEQDRRDRLDQLLADAHDDGQTWAGYPQAWRKLRNAEELVERGPAHLQDAERKELEVVRNEVESRRQQFQTEINEKWLVDFEAWEQQRQQLDRTDLDAIQQSLREGEELAKRSHVEAVHQNQIGPRLEGLTKDYQNQMETQTEAQLVARVTESLDDRERYIRSLETYIERFGHTPRAADFKKVVEDESGYWDGIEAWERFIAHWATLQIKGISPAQAGERIEEAEVLLEKHPGYPAAETVQKMIEYLEPIRARVGPDGPIANRLVPTVGSSKDVRDTFMVLRQRGKVPVRYYFRGEEPKVVLRILRVAHLIYLQSDEVRVVDIPLSEVASPKDDDGESYDWTSPQQKFFIVLTQHMRELEDSTSTWESVFFRVLQHLYEDPLMDPVLKVQLLGLILPTACDGSYAIRQAFGAWRDRIQRTAEDRTVNFAADWVDPDDTTANQARTAAQTLLDSLEPMQRASARAEQAWKEMLAPRVWPRYQWIGCLLQESASNWTCALGPPSESLTGDLVVVYPGEGTTPVFMRIGRLADGRVTLAGTTGRVEGRPVFVRIGP